MIKKRIVKGIELKLKRVLFSKDGNVLCILPFINCDNKHGTIKDCKFVVSVAIAKGKPLLSEELRCAELEKGEWEFDCLGLKKALKLRNPPDYTGYYTGKYPRKMEFGVSMFFNKNKQAKPVMYSTEDGGPTLKKIGKKATGAPAPPPAAAKPATKVSKPTVKPQPAPPPSSLQISAISSAVKRKKKVIKKVKKSGPKAAPKTVTVPPSKKKDLDEVDIEIDKISEKLTEKALILKIKIRNNEKETFASGTIAVEITLYKQTIPFDSKLFIINTKLKAGKTIKQTIEYKIEHLGWKIYDRTHEGYTPYVVEKK